MSALESELDKREGFYSSTIETNTVQHICGSLIPAQLSHTLQPTSTTIPMVNSREVFRGFILRLP